MNHNEEKTVKVYRAKRKQKNIRLQLAYSWKYLRFKDVRKEGRKERRACRRK